MADFDFVIARSEATIAVGTLIAERPPHRTVQAAFPHTACMGLSLSRGRHANLVVLCIPFFCSTRAASTLPSRPHISIAVAAQQRSTTALPSAPPKACPCRTRARRQAAGDRVVGRAMIRGEPAIGRDQSREPRLYSVEPVWGVPTMKQSYASAGKAPRRRVHSLSGIAAIAECGLPPPRIVIGNPAYQVRSGCRTLFVLSRSRVLLTPPAAARHRPAPRRS